jgi:hypothetical protein
MGKSYSFLVKPVTTFKIFRILRQCQLRYFRTNVQTVESSCKLTTLAGTIYPYVHSIKGAVLLS